MEEFEVNPFSIVDDVDINDVNNNEDLKKLTTYEEDDNEEDITIINNDPNLEEIVDQDQDEDLDQEDEFEEDQDLSNFSDASLILHEYVKEGLVNYTEKINPNLKGKELMEILKANALEQNLEQLRNEGYNEEFKKTIEFLKGGGNLEDLKTLYQINSYSQLDISDDVDLSNRELIMKEYYKEQGLSDKKAEQLWNLSVEADETYEDSLEAQDYFKTKESNLIESQKAAKQKEEELQQKQLKEARENAEKILDSGKLLDFTISKKEINDIKDALFKETELYEYKDDSGKLKKIKLSKYQVALEKYNQNHEWQLMFAKLLLDNFDFSKLINKVKTQRDNETLDFLNGRRKRAIKKTENISNRGTNNYYTNVQEYNIE